MTGEFDHIDQKIRQKFENFEPEPPVKVWENIQDALRKTPPSSPSGGFMLPIIVAVSLIIFISGLIYHFSNDRNYPAAGSNEKSVVSKLEAGVLSTGSTAMEDLTMQQLFYETPQDININTPQENTESEQEVEIPADIPVRAPFDLNIPNTSKKNITEKVKDQPQARGQWKPGLVDAISAGELTYGQALAYDLSMRDIRKLSRDAYYTKNPSLNWSLGLYFNPEAINCEDASVENTMAYNLSVLPQLQFRNLFLQSGFNLRFTHDKGNYAVDYNRYLGSYEDVYEVTFDTTENGVIPTYHTHTVDVFDTVNHYSVSETKANYTYLEIPLYLGYRYSFGKFSLFAKAGPAASFLLVENIPAPSSPEEKARIVNVDYQVPLRHEINWQLMMGAGFEYKLADKVSFSLEPTFRYAFKPEYDLTEGARGNTRSYGVRAGLIYNFK